MERWSAVNRSMQVEVLLTSVYSPPREGPGLIVRAHRSTSVVGCDKALKTVKIASLKEYDPIDPTRVGGCLRGTEECETASGSCYHVLPPLKGMIIFGSAVTAVRRVPA